MSKEVVIAGVGQTSLGEHWDFSLRELAFHAVEAAMQDAGGIRPQAVFVANMLASVLSHQGHLGALIADFAGLWGVEAMTVEAAGASGGVAFRQALLAVASGAVDAALVVGVEKLTDQVGSRVDAAKTIMLDSDYESVQGVTPSAQAGMLMRRYMYEYEVPREAFAGFPIVAHENGVHNPNAMFRRAISEKIYQRAPLTSDPLNVFDEAPDADGAAAVLLTRRDLLPPEFSHPLVGVAGSNVSTDTLALHDRPDMLRLRAAERSVQIACQQAGLKPEQVDLFELYDAYSIYAALSLEAAGFAAAGRGWELAQNGALRRDGSIPICTFGGLKARGNPGGATGVYQIVEAALQLRGEANENQVEGARTALVQCFGGLASTVATHVLARLED